MVVAVLTGKTKHSVRNTKTSYSQDPEICPVRARTAYRTQPVAENGQRPALHSAATRSRGKGR
jgi:hypothetical protein